MRQGKNMKPFEVGVPPRQTVLLRQREFTRIAVGLLLLNALCLLGELVFVYSRLFFVGTTMTSLAMMMALVISGRYGLRCPYCDWPLGWDKDRLGFWGPRWRPLLRCPSCDRDLAAPYDPAMPSGPNSTALH